MWDAHFGHAISDRFHITWIAKFQPADTNDNAGLGRGVAQPVQPPPKDRRLANLDHM